MSAIFYGIGSLNVGERVIHVQRREDPALQELLKWHSGDLRDHQAKHYIAGIAVGPTRPRGEFAARLLLQKIENFAILNLVLGGPPGIHQVFVIAQASRVSQKMPDSDRTPVCREFREDFR
jgi:hypothetical protein